MNTLPEGEQLRVLIADDQSNWRQTLVDVLGTGRYDIETTSNYEETKSILQQRAFHVLVTDLRLVDADANNTQGILLLDDVGALQDGMQTIIVTGYPSIETAKQALKDFDAFDYLLKHPEKGGPFDIKLYREQVKKAAEHTIVERQKIFKDSLSLSALKPGVNYELILEALFPADSNFKHQADLVDKVVHRLLQVFRPLTPGMNKIWISNIEQALGILCWSREYSKAVLIKVLGKEKLSDIDKPLKLQSGWLLSQHEQFTALPIAGVSYTIVGMTFDEFTKLIQEE